MTPEIEDALYSACHVTTREKIGDYVGGNKIMPPSSVTEFKAKLRAFLRELHDGMTIQELLEDLEDI